MTVTMEYGKELPEQLSIHREHNRSHTQTNVHISTRLVSEQDEISGLETIGVKIIHGNTCH